MDDDKWTHIYKVMDEERLAHPDFKAIFGSHFNDDDEATTFGRKCLEKEKTRLMLNRIEWFVKLADEQKHDSVRMSFLIAMAETNVSLFENRFDEPDIQKTDVEKFFDSFSTTDKNELQKGFYKENDLSQKEHFAFEVIIDILMNIRHRLVHGKSLYHFNFHNGMANSLNYIEGEIGPKKAKQKLEYQLDMTYKEFRKLMIKYAIENVQKCL